MEYRQVPVMQLRELLCALRENDLAGQQRQSVVFSELSGEQILVQQLVCGKKLCYNHG
jgi:hypothetical protein